jgi:hypothetical protein
MQGASWEQAFAASQHFGARVTFICPATLAQVKAYTDKGVAVMIAWNPEGRPWSHASVIKDVDDEGNVTVADPNIPDPDVLTRTLPKAEFYGKWYEKAADYLVRRPAMAVEREISPEGRQMVASAKSAKKDMYEVHGFSDQGKNHVVYEATSQKGAYKVAVQFKNEGYVGYIVTPEKQKIYFHMLTPTFRKFGLGNAMNPIVARVATRHMQAFQFALAQAFADQVGMPERMTLAQLTKLLEQAFIDMVKDLEWESNGLDLDGMTTVDLEYGPTKHYRNSPSERAEGSFDVPEGAAGSYTARVPIRNLANSLMYMKTPTTFFRHKGREILEFLASPKNRILLEKFLFDVSLDVSDFPFNEIDQDTLNEIFDDNKDSLVEGTASASQSVQDVDWKFEGNSLVFRVAVYFSYDDTRDLEAGEAEPDPDDRDDYDDY